MKLSDIERTVPAVLTASQEAVCLVGAPGIGKTSICKPIAEKISEITKRETVVLVQHTAYEEPVDAKGIPVPEVINTEQDKSAVKVMQWIPPSTLPLEELLTDDRNILWVLDDIGQAHPQVQNGYARAFHSAERLIAGRKLGENVYVMATTNRMEDGAAVFEMPSFARMRTTFIDVDVSAEDWVSWAYKQNNVPEEFIGFVHPANKLGGTKHIFDFDPARRTNCSPRTLHIAAKHWQALKGESAEVVDEYLRGIVCPAFPVEFRAHIRLYDKLPDVNAILAGKDVDYGFALDPSVLFLVINSLLKRARNENVNALAKFLNKLPDSRVDFGVMFFLEARKLIPQISMHPLIVGKDGWGQRNKAILKAA